MIIGVVLIVEQYSIISERVRADSRRKHAVPIARYVCRKSSFAMGNVFPLRWISDSRRASISAISESLSSDRRQIE